MFVVALAAALGAGGYAAWQRAHREARTIAWTTCPFFGPPSIVIVTDLQPWDTMPTRVHEDVHAAQCRELGPIRYRLRNLTTAGRLAAEAPAFCAAAVARLRVDPDSSYVADRLRTDAVEGLSHVADSLTIMLSLMSSCPALAGHEATTHRSPRVRRAR